MKCSNAIRACIFWLIVLCPLAAQAQVSGYDPSTNSCYRNVPYRDIWTDHITYRRVWAQCVQAYERNYGPRVYGYERRARDEVRGRGECLAPRTVVGIEKYNIEEAKENAISLWMEAEKFHNGVKYMNPENAIVLSSDGRGPDCFISSTGNRVSEEIAARANKTLHQCEYRARPCEGPLPGEERRGRR